MAVNDGRTTTESLDYLTGLEEVLTKLKTLKTTKAKAALRKGTRAGSKVVAAALKQAAPRKTGNLASKIKVRALPRSRKYVGASAQVDMYYAAFGELGTVHQKAIHWMKKASAEVKDRALATAIEVIKEEINKA